VVFGFKVFEGFNTLNYTKDHILEIPRPGEQPIGGHAMMMAGYDLDRQLVLCRNSFGPDWCMGGYCWIPFEYIRNEAFDSWIFDVDLIDS
jgi:C1A family cysteine protease